MNAIYNRQIGKAQVIQLNRVNRQKSDIRTLPDALAEITRLNHLLDLSQEAEARKDAELEQLRARQAEMEDSGSVSPRPIGGSSTLLIGGRPVITQAQAARQIGTSIATVSRYCDSEWWQCVKQGGRIFIFADQPLNRKRK